MLSMNTSDPNAPSFENTIYNYLLYTAPSLVESHSKIRMFKKRKLVIIVILIVNEVLLL